MIVGLTGYARAGKDTAAEVLIEAGWKRIAFADSLREMLHALNPLIGRGQLRVADIVEMNGWTEAKKWSEIRQLLQRLGTEAGRNILGESIWIDTALAKVASPLTNYVITDVRYPNEANAIRAMGGWIGRITREGTAPVNAHPSETALDDYPWDWEFHNTGTVEDLREIVKAVLL